MHDVAWWILGAGLVLYVLTAGADFGGGLWHLVARGPRARDERAAIEHAIAPIWEANHVWLIFMIVVLFTAYPRAFAAIAIACHVPIALALVGVVLRGSAFVFGSYGLGGASERARYGRVFGTASALTPVALGLVLAAIASGSITVDASGSVVRVTSGFFAGWTSLFAIATGLFTLSLFALLASVYLTRDAPAAVAESFRARALGAEIVAGALAYVVYFAAERDAPLLRARLVEGGAFALVELATAASAMAVMASLWARRFELARALVILQVALVVGGFGLAMRGDLLLGALSTRASIGTVDTSRPILVALALGSVLLVPSLAYLYRLFKRAPRRA
ncbi:MAG: cytochrome d ubiquinol oxidase subunit II [Polyangiaceae bacterium]